MTDQIEILETGIPGLDDITEGGLPARRTTLVAGSAGSGKTVLAAQFLAAGIEQGDNGVFVTFEEPPDDIRLNMASFGWDIAGWEAAGRWRFVDASLPEDEISFAGDHSLEALQARIGAAIEEVGARRVAMDSLSALFLDFPDPGVIRRGMRQLARHIRDLGATTLLSAERPSEDGSISRHGVEEYVADNVLVLRQSLENEAIRRTIQVLKVRGTGHRKGQFPFAVVSGQGMSILPVTAVELDQGSRTDRMSSGDEQLDEMTSGGFFRDSVVLVSGATGTGKTLTVTEFLGAGAVNGERCLLCAFEESREQLYRNAEGWGVDFRGLEAEGLLKIIACYPEELTLEEHLLSIRAAIDEFQPSRFALDSLSALERVGTDRSFRQFTIGLTSFVKDRQVTGMFTSTTPTLLGGESVTSAHISTLTDTILLLRYVEMFGTVKRGLAVLKMRGSAHDKDIREITITGEGLQIGQPFRELGGILSGVPTHLPAREIRALEDLLDDMG